MKIVKVVISYNILNIGFGKVFLLQARRRLSDGRSVRFVHD